MELKAIQRVPNVVNVICFIIVLVVAAVFGLNPFQAVHQGFFCDDLSIRYPYLPETVSIALLLCTCFIPAALLIFVLEITYGILAKRDEHAAGLDTSNSSSDNKTRLQGFKSGLTKAGLLFACLIYGNALCFSVTEVFKLSFGRLRPSFLSACQPETDVTTFPNCTSWYIEEIRCLNPDTKTVMDMRKSFLSGHASFSVFNMVFIILYLQRRLPLSTPRLVVSLLQSVAMGYAVFICATRLLDHYHHPTDILSGAILGMVFSAITVFKMCPRFVRHPPPTEGDLLPVSSSVDIAKQGTPLTPTSVTVS